VHPLPADLRKALIANSTALDAWKDITPLARICWVEDAKQEMTRERRIRRTEEELEEGQRRPCCWPGAGTVSAPADSYQRTLGLVLRIGSFVPIIVVPAVAAHWPDPRACPRGPPVNYSRDVV
jgi:hypothetical protein